MGSTSNEAAARILPISSLARSRTCRSIIRTFDAQL